MKKIFCMNCWVYLFIYLSSVSLRGEGAEKRIGSTS